jgi:hypothetical protein
MNQPEYDPNMYEQILTNFDTFCDQFEGAAAKRFAGLDNDSRQPIDNTTVKRETPRAAKEVDDGGEEGITIRTPPIDVQATPMPKLSDSSGDA